MTDETEGAKETCFAFGGRVDEDAEEASLEEVVGGRATGGVDADAEEAGLEEGDGGRATEGVEGVGGGVATDLSLLKRLSISSKMAMSVSS